MESNETTVAGLFGGDVEPRDTRERILFEALNLFMVHGFHAIGLDRILAAVRVSKTTFYNHFESKDHLAREAVELRARWEGAAFRRRLHELAGYDPRALLLAYFDVWDEWFNDEAYQRCVFLSATVEYPFLGHPVHAAARHHIQATEDRIAEIARAAGVPDPTALARTWMQLLEGATTYRVVMGRNDAARVARRTAVLVLQEALAPEPAACGGY